LRLFVGQNASLRAGAFELRLRPLSPVRLELASEVVKLALDGLVATRNRLLGAVKVE
jgi:hypothetical protein